MVRAVYRALSVHLSRAKCIARSTIDMPWRNFLKSGVYKKVPEGIIPLNTLEDWSKEPPCQNQIIPSIRFDRTPTCAGTSAGFWLGVNAPLPSEAKKILKIRLRNGAF